MLSPILYRKDVDGRVRTWQFEVQGDKFRTISGLIDGKKVTSEWTTTVPKNTGRSNATTAEQQAQAEAQADFDKKLDRRYRLTIPELDEIPLGCMLARDYAKQKAKFTSGFSQPKLDGIRALLRKNGAFSRGFQRHKSTPHIEEVLAPVFRELPGLTLDGELYNHDLRDDFNSIGSFVRKEKGDEAQRSAREKVLQYHVYDLMWEDDFTVPFSVRNRQLQELFDRFDFGGIVHFVPTREVKSVDELDEHYAEVMSQGYEGQMVRLDLPYEPDTRSKSLLKRKEFMTEEFPLLRIEEGLGNWSGMAKKIYTRVDGAPDGIVGGHLRGSQEFARKLLQEWKSWDLSRATVTVRFFGRTPDGSLRFPVAIDFHPEGRKD